jgi:hypothetical protein
MRHTSKWRFSWEEWVFQTFLGVGRLGVFHSFPKTMDQMNGVLKISNPIPSKV